MAPKQTVRKAFRLRSGDLYVFDFVVADGSWTIYCRQHPDNPFTTDVHKTHLYSDGSLCVTEKLQSLDRAKAFALIWASGYSNYTRTGTFRPSQTSVNV